MNRLFAVNWFWAATMLLLVAGCDCGTSPTGTVVLDSSCEAASDCEADFGAAPCGEWQCKKGVCQVDCPDCSDSDKDGFGEGGGCAGPDCDDANARIGANSSRSCYSGTARTSGVGACTPGTETCTAGVWTGTCEGEVTPTTETCDNEDNDCDGVTDMNADAAADCLATQGAPSCSAGTYACNAGACEVSCGADCTDADGDGYGVGADCAGPDCDDADATVGSDATKPCYSGTAGTEGIGECKGGTDTCSAGTWSGCIGETIPTVEVCNDKDDDCDGTTDQSSDADADCAIAGGNPPCGRWMCAAGGACRVDCPGCTDADGDGYGPETTACGGPDCDDNDQTIGSDAARSCYSGRAGTDGVGVCKAGTESCTGGIWTACVGEITPSGEACNDTDDDCDTNTDEGMGMITCDTGICQTQVAACATGTLGVCPAPGTGAAPDDSACDGMDNDCDGSTDEDCAASSCVWVVDNPGACGSGAQDGSTTAPFGCIQDAIDAADPTAGEYVCVTATSCNTTAYVEALTMRSGVSVVGNFDPALNGNKCPGRLTAVRTVLEVPPIFFGNGSPTPTLEAVGVTFGPRVTAPTTFQDFRIIRGNASTSVGIRLDGAKNVTIREVYMDGDSYNAVANSIGVELINGAEGLITQSRIFAGNGFASSMAISSISSTPTILDNCAARDAQGRCTDRGCNNWCCNPSCNGQAQKPGLYGVWYNGRQSQRAADMHIVYLEDSPGAVVEANPIHLGNALYSSDVRVLGDATGTVIRGNDMETFGRVNAHAIWLTDCGGASPWIVDNLDLLTEGSFPSSVVEGIRSVGDCHPVIDSNQLIRGGSEGGASRPTGVHCGTDATGASRCTILNNAVIQGSSWQFPLEANGVRCDDGACLRIEGNTIRGGDPGNNAGALEIWGLWMTNTGPYVANNDISGGCGILTTPSVTGFNATGVYAKNSWARLENNRIWAGHCGNIGRTMGPNVVGMHVVNEDGRGLLDVHSNLIVGDGDPVACTSTGVYLDTGRTAPTVGLTTWRNNIIASGGRCQTARYNVVEAACMADPAVFENNDVVGVAFAGSQTPTALYQDMTDCNGATSDLMAATDIDALTDMSSGGNLDVDPGFGGVGFPHLEDTTAVGVSPLDGAGTATGAPATDMDGDPRSTTAPDIGPDECVTNDCVP